MIFEHRQYEVAPGRMTDLIERFKKHTIRLFERHGIEPVLFSIPISETENNVFFYIVKFKDANTMENCWKSFLEDKERIQIWDESNKNGKLVLKIESNLFKEVVL